MSFPVKFLLFFHSFPKTDELIAPKVLMVNNNFIQYLLDLLWKGGQGENHICPKSHSERDSLHECSWSRFIHVSSLAWGKPPETCFLVSKFTSS